MSDTNQNRISERWKAVAQIAKDEARTLSLGKDRDALIKKARQLETASHINEWLSSPGLRSPT